ncbi:hypothetical protein FSO04_40885 [Paraburkholderia madseniana]|uniref:Uncharacterized protein n=1 Tax=Paraburkholderia madseniana TaxID=2599607 RepID=A0A6N6W2W7_9BURK|nr:hypothetical protein FSO04_40885 [Paraburkholderia madseniana]NPT68927.1 hypothetical protein [Paraburkholderia madseniana]
MPVTPRYQSRSAVSPASGLSFYRHGEWRERREWREREWRREQWREHEWHGRGRWGGY